LLNVLVTGAGGLIGGELCARLVAKGHRVTAMVRNRRQVLGNDGKEVPVARTVTGDVTKPIMGLAPEPQHVVVHCAAHLDFDAPEEDLQRINVAGTAQAIAYAREAGAAFLHVSTAYVCGEREGAIAEAPVPQGTRFTNRYEASKAAAEQLVAQSGLRFAIARPSIVLGDSATGAIRDFPSLCNVFRLMARGKVTTFPAAADSSLDLVPIDHVAEGLARLVERMDKAAGGWFHLVADAPLPAAELAHGVARVDHFPSPKVVDPQDYDPQALTSSEQLLAGRMLATYGAYFTRSPRFASDAFAALTGLACPPCDRGWLDRLIAHGIARGYLPPPPLSECRDRDRRAAFAHPEPTSSRP